MHRLRHRLPVALLLVALAGCVHGQLAEDSSHPLIVWEVTSSGLGRVTSFALFPDGRAFLFDGRPPPVRRYRVVQLNADELHVLLRRIPIDALASLNSERVITGITDLGLDTIAVWSGGRVHESTSYGAGDWYSLKQHPSASESLLLPLSNPAAVERLAPVWRLFDEVERLRNQARAWSPERIRLDLVPYTGSDKPLTPKPWPTDVVKLYVTHPCDWWRGSNYIPDVDVILSGKLADPIENVLRDESSPFLIDGCPFWVHLTYQLPGEQNWGRKLR